MGGFVNVDLSSSSAATACTNSVTMTVYGGHNAMQATVASSWESIVGTLALEEISALKSLFQFVHMRRAS